MTESRKQEPDAVNVDGQTAESWGKVMARFSDANLYQSWAYGATRWGERNLSHWIRIRNGEPLAAAQLRILRIPALPVGIAYLRWGPMCQPDGRDPDPLVLTEAIASLRHEYCERRGMALKIVPNAFTGDPRGATFQEAFTLSGLKPLPGTRPYRTVRVDLTADDSLLRNRLHQKWRNQLNQAERNSLRLESDQGAAAYLALERLYCSMRDRKRFATSIDIRQFRKIQEQLPAPVKIRFSLAFSGDQPVAGLACSLMGETGIYLFGATNDAARTLKAAYLLQWHTMMWLKRQGARSYDLGGIDQAANPGVYHFKSGFGGRELTQLPPQGRSNSIWNETLLQATSYLP